MMAQGIQPKIGMRFALHASKFEIVFVANGLIRYAASAGGRPFKMSVEKFIELQEQDSITSLSVCGSKVNEHTAPALVRRHRYVEAARGQLVHPTALIPLASVIQQVADECSDISPPSVRTVARWVNKYQLLGLDGLHRLKFSGNYSVRFDLEVERLIGTAIQEIYLQRERSNARGVRDYIVGKLYEMGLCNAHDQKIRIPTLRTIQRRLKEIDPFIVIRAQQGEVAANRAIRAAGRSIKSASILSIVQIDSHKLDVLVVDPDSGEVLGRPYLTCILDVHTRMVIGIHISLYPPSAVTALAALKNMLVHFGIPSQIVPDGGVEFVNTSFSRVCQILAITITQAQVRDPNGKANIESFFRTLTYDLIQKLSGTTFSNPSMRGDYDSTKNACLTLEQVAARIGQWLDLYHNSPHSRTGRAPILVWQDQTKIMPALTMTAEDVDALARRPILRSIQHGRVRVSGIEYYSHVLATCQAQGEKRVTVLIDDLDLHTVLVQHPTEKDVLIQAESTDAKYTFGLTSYMHREAMLIKRQMSASDRQKYGQNANAIARHQLLESIHSECRASKKWISKLTAGKGRKREIERQQAQMQRTTPFEDAEVPSVESSAPPTLLPGALESDSQGTNSEITKPFDSLDLE